jgi:hypothetical protein
VPPPFLPGLELSRALFEEAVAPLLARHVPGVRYSAARLGSGSEVLGLDTPRSADHEWGPRLQVFLTDDDLAVHGPQVGALLSAHLPATVRGWSTHFGPADAAVRTMQPADGPVRHRVDVVSVGGWSHAVLGFDARETPTTFDWLATPAQRLAEVTAGEVFHDGPGELTRARARLAWYPRDVWLYLLACQWQRIGQEEAFPGRCAEVGDDLGSAIVTARLARDLMRLCLLMGRCYPPYSKWLGTAFARLPGTAGLGATLAAAVSADGWRAREQHLCRAYEAVAERHNRLGVTPPLDTKTRGFYDRPFQVIGAERFTAALLEAIADPVVKQLPAFGAVDQFTDSTDALGNLSFLRASIAAALG